MVVRTLYMEAEQETKLGKIENLGGMLGDSMYEGTVAEARVVSETARLE